MTRTGLSTAIGLLAAVMAVGCATPRTPAVVYTDGVGVMPADARALRYGASAPEIFNNPEMRDKIRALFGSDWEPGSQGGGRLQYGAVNYFPANSPIRMLRVGDQEYIAIKGCVPNDCATHGGLILIRSDGSELWSRLDEGGFSRYYGHGPSMTSAAVSPAFIDSAWRAVERVERA